MAWTWGGRAACMELSAWLLLGGFSCLLDRAGAPAGHRVEGMLSLRAADFLKRRLLVGALRLDPDELRASGVGDCRPRHRGGRVRDVAHAGAIMGILSVVELAIASVLLWRRRGPRTPHLLAGLRACVVAWRYYRVRQRWPMAASP